MNNTKKYLEHKLGRELTKDEQYILDTSFSLGEQKMFDRFMDKEYGMDEGSGKHAPSERAAFTEEEVGKLLNSTILELAHELEHAITNDLLHEDLSVYEFIKKYYKDYLN
jgi:hypothetical protein